MAALLRAPPGPVIDVVDDADSPQDLFDGIVGADVRAIARALRFVDDREPGYIELLKALYARGGGAYVMGVTGTPGAGKSTLVDHLIERFRALDKTVGVIAVDPTSPYSGGAILGDRIRMQRHFLDDGVFIRSLATRGHLGGLSRSAGEVMRVFDAAGYDIVLIETVGVGQDELEVTRLAHTTLVVMAPGMGDDVQAIKAGILEVADVFVVNKADRDGADATVRDLEQMIALGGAVMKAAPGHHGAPSPRAASGAQGHHWTPLIVKTVATSGEGLDPLIDACQAHRLHVACAEPGEARARLERELWALLKDGLLTETHDRLTAQVSESVDRIARGDSDPFSEAELLLRSVLGEG